MSAPDDNSVSESADRRRPRRPRSQLRDIAGRRIIAEGLERNFWTDLYFNAMTISWPRFVGALAAAFVALNFIFAVIYDLGDAPIANAREGSFRFLGGEALGPHYGLAVGDMEM